MRQAFHPRCSVVLIVEVKSALGDLQDALGRLDVKVRLGRFLADTSGWSDVRAVVPAFVFGDTRAVRRTIASHEAIFGHSRARQVRHGLDTATVASHAERAHVVRERAGFARSEPYAGSTRANRQIRALTVTW